MADVTILDLLPLLTASPPSTCSIEIVNPTVLTDSLLGSSQRATIAQLFQSPTIDSPTVTTVLTVSASANLVFASRVLLDPVASGILVLSATAAPGFTSLVFGGYSTGFPALSVSGTTLSATLGDGSNVTNFVAAVITGTRVVGGTDISGAVAKVVASDGTTFSGISLTNTLGLVSTAVSAATSGNPLCGQVYIKATAANSGGPQALEGGVQLTHTSGTTTLAIATIGNIFVNGVGGTTTAVRGLQGGGSVSNGTVGTFASICAAAPGISGTGVITTLIGVQVGNISGGGTNYAIKTGTGLVSFGDALTVTSGGAAITGNSTVTGTLNVTVTATAAGLLSTAGITSNAPTGAGIGYTTGAGGAVTQVTNRGTTVVVNKLTGTITTTNDSLAAEANQKFTVTNSTVAIGDTISISQQGGSNGGNTDVTVTGVAAGSFQLNVSNDNASGGAAETGAILINFAVIKAVSA